MTNDQARQVREEVAAILQDVYDAEMPFVIVVQLPPKDGDGTMCQLDIVTNAEKIEAVPDLLDAAAAAARDTAGTRVSKFS